MIIGLDVGGTHTDVVLLGSPGLLNAVKVHTDAANLFDTVLKGLDAVMKGIDPSEIERIVLSTTLTTNAVIQSKVPEVGLIVSGGPGIDPEFFRIGSHYYPVSGSIDHRGREVDPIQADEILRISKKMRQEGILNVGVVSKFSVRNPAHELEIFSLMKGSFDSVFLGHRVSGGLSFPRRIATTYLNAAVYPLHRDFFSAVEKSLRQKGLNVPIRILKADGGNMSFGASIDFPMQTILSGPAASIMGAIAFAPRDSETLVLDVGGTTTDMAVLINGAPLVNPVGINVGPYQTLVRSLETHSIGMGGDSEVRVENGEIRIGPERKGPAMAYDGPVPTPTDALFVLGKNTGGDREKSARGFEPIAGALGMSVEGAAKKVFDLASGTILLAAGEMIRRINAKPVYTVHEMLEGHQVRPGTVLVLGGPAVQFAECFREISDFEVSVVPRWAVANAIGAGLARTTSEVVLFADTERGMAVSPGENYRENISRNFSKKDAVELACSLLREKALKRGANPDYLEMEVVEDLEFNMVRNFSTTGKNIRVKVQVKPGLIRGHQTMLANLAATEQGGVHHVKG